LAERDLKTALFLEPGEVLAHYYLGRIAYRRGEIEKAIEEWRLAFPSRYSFTIYEAIVYGRRGMDYNLLPQLRRICPTGLLVLPYLELARLYEEKGLMAKAKELYQQLSHYDPDFGVYISHQRRE
jgi:tetratricopeptide (TPR) repeat protein